MGGYSLVSSVACVYVNIQRRNCVTDQHICIDYKMAEYSTVQRFSNGGSQPLEGRQRIARVQGVVCPSVI